VLNAIQATVQFLFLFKWQLRFFPLSLAKQIVNPLLLIP